MQKNKRLEQLKERLHEKCIKKQKEESKKTYIEENQEIYDFLVYHCQVEPTINNIYMMHNILSSFRIYYGKRMDTNRMSYYTPALTKRSPINCPDTCLFEPICGDNYEIRIKMSFSTIFYRYHEQVSLLFPHKLQILVIKILQKNLTIDQCKDIYYEDQTLYNKLDKLLIQHEQYSFGIHKEKEEKEEKENNCSRIFPIFPHFKHPFPFPQLDTSKRIISFQNPYLSDRILKKINIMFQIYFDKSEKELHMQQRISVSHNISSCKKYGIYSNGIFLP